MKFTKMHGLGNDYVYVNGFEQKVADPAEVARKVADRHTGIGGDGLILILPSEKADVRMRMFNADGSEAEMCGNGIRCVAKYSYDHGLSKNNPMKVETGRGVLELDLKVAGGKVEQVTVNMGAPVLDLEKIPVDPGRVVKSSNSAGYMLRTPLDVENMVFVSMGNPHAVIFSPKPVIKKFVEEMGPIIERDPAFPRRINVHWAVVLTEVELQMSTWERGSGITRACGTGACAVLVASVLTGQSKRRALVHLPGGELVIEWRESDNCVYMTGPATEVFSGEWNG